MDELKEIRLNYEVVFETLMREKNREELQKLEPSFYKDVADYISEKFHKSRMESASFEEKEKASKQMQNITKMCRELYDRRERKIANIALIKSRTNSIIDSSSLLGNEQPFFGELVKVFGRYREEILNSAVSVPTLSASPEKRQEYHISQSGEPLQETTKMIRFVHAVPKFIGKDLEIYGPFEEEDVATLPSEIADILIKKGRADVISTD